jgi:hypothetical protein
MSNNKKTAQPNLDALNIHRFVGIEINGTALKLQTCHTN